ncbi:tyrosine-protein kinase receptor Tie-2 [Esox lucius]|uniref:receptor protein-tyrosine kinase n=1 Tax=Esox lucius TaxID=8010 RepID=A0A3P9A2I2_ESOLU|nr:tyrosine-protein kinase receptor Tie-2 [Esox lucius]
MYPLDTPSLEPLPAYRWNIMSYLYSSLAVCLIYRFTPGEALDVGDLTLVNPDPMVTSSDSSLHCVSSDWTTRQDGSPSSSTLVMGRSYPLPYPQNQAVSPDTVYHHASKLQWKTRSDMFGEFYCRASKGDPSQIYTYKMLNEAAFLPETLTITVSIGEDVNISFTRRKCFTEDVVIYKNDSSFIHSLPQNEVSDVLVYPIKGVTLTDAGLYTVYYIARAKSTSAILRLIVRKCKSGLWGPGCEHRCPQCSNGGICHDETGECICPPGFKGHSCETVCGQGRFGRSCKVWCRDGNCRSMVFCQRDPYGCSCGTGWRGFNCSEPCPPGYYGAGCKLRCQCDDTGRCDRFRGCVCPGRHGARCEREDRAPVVVSQLTDTELNSGIHYLVNCSATGQPAPLHGDIVLLKPDKTKIYAFDTDTVSNQTISQFKVDRITERDAGRWVCQVNTTAGQTEREFLVTVKVPPMPLYPPMLNDSGPYHVLLLVKNKPYTGDGPVTSIKVIYKQVNRSMWEAVEVSGPVVKLENLSPMTQYTASVLLSRDGAGGVGFPGPETSFSTQMLDLPLPSGVRLVPVSQTSLDLSWDRVMSPESPKEDLTYQVECVQSSDPGNVKTYQLPSNSSGLSLTELKPRHRYECRVRMMTLSVGQHSQTVFAWTFSNELPPEPSNIQSCNITDTSAIITWSLAEGHSISKVMLRFQENTLADYSQLAEINVQQQGEWHGQEANQMHFQLRGLKPDTPYLVEMWSQNNMGESLGKPQVLLRTTPSQESAPQAGFGSKDNMLFFAILGSAGMTCITILLAFCIVLQLKRATFQRRMVRAFQNIVREEPVVQFSSGSLNLPNKKHKNPEQPVSYPALEWSDIKFQDVIGEGNFGQVLKARIKKDGLRMDAAIKRMKEYASKDDHRDFAGELEVLCKLGHHPNIINLLGACEHRGYLYLAIEFAPHGNLLDFLRKSRVLETDPAFAIANSTASTLTSQQLLHFAADVARGMDYLAQKQFIHRDLAARNILVGENFVAKIADFGLSRGQEVYVKKTMGRLPVRWMAIESLNYSVYTTNSDVWSYGVLLWEIVSLGGTPYCGMTCAELYEKLPQSYRLEKPLNCDDEVYDLMRQCWREKPYERPSFQQILVSLNRMLEERKTYVNTTLYEKFTYAGIDCSAEEAG